MKTKRPSSRRGMSLVEVLVASLILALLMLGVLEMFSLSLLTDRGSAARTDLTYKCQQVVENIRYVQFLKNGNVTGSTAPLSSATGIPDTPSTTTKYALPYKSTDTGWAYWGPAGANVMEEGDGGPYQVFYTFTTNSATDPFWTVTVTAQPTAKAKVGTATAASGKAYLGAGSIVKSVEYVAQLRKS